VARGDPTAPAASLAIRRALRDHRDRVAGATLYVTLEPCLMCAGAIVLARIGRVVYGCDDPKTGAVRSLYTTLSDNRLNHRCQVTPGVAAAPSSELLVRFFEDLRSRRPR
jgi:tRNA(adenine34) deaminase